MIASPAPSPAIEPVENPKFWRAQSAWNVAGLVAYYGCIWLQTWAVARFRGPAELGSFALAMTIVQPLFQFTGLNLKTVQAMESENLGVYLRARLALAGAACLLCLTPAPWAGYLVFLLALVRSGDSISEVFQADLLRQGRADIASRYMALRGVVGLLVLLAGLLTSLPLEIAVLGMAVSSMVLLGVHHMEFLGLFRSWRDSLRLVQRTLPIGSALICSSLGISIPIWIYKSVGGDSAVGQVYPAVHLQAAAVVIVSGVCQAHSSRVGAAFAANQLGSFRSMLLPLFRFAAALGLAGVVAAGTFGSALIRAVFSAAFLIAKENLVLFAIAVFFSLHACVLGFGATATRRFDLLWRPYLWVPIVSLVVAATLIPWLGSAGFAVALIASAVVGCLAPLFVLRRVGAVG